uniref:Uncharacterized protein n=1 Tax=Anguilla anguilla TaxID=7936 RepID=A0A0E9PMB6_ANGAN
MISPRNQML